MTELIKTTPQTEQVPTLQTDHHCESIVSTTLAVYGTECPTEPSTVTTRCELLSDGDASLLSERDSTSDVVERLCMRAHLSAKGVCPPFAAGQG